MLFIVMDSPHGEHSHFFFVMGEDMNVVVVLNFQNTNVGKQD